MIESHGARVNIIPGTRDMCANACRAKVDICGKYYASHVYNPFFYEGTKTYIYEVYEQLHRIPQNIFIPLGNGTLFIGAIKALEELIVSDVIGSMPHIVAVQSERCDPLAKAAAAGEKHPAKVTPVLTMAEGIAIGEPMRGDEILEYIYKYKIEVVTAPEARILEARGALAAKGVYCEHTTAATYAAYLDYCDSHGNMHDCLIPMCGAGLKSDK
jgi:threonine synthase